MLKNRTLIAITLCFFLIINTTYYWEAKLGAISLMIFLMLIIVFLSLIFSLIKQTMLSIDEKFQDKQRLILILFLVTVLSLTIFKPSGLIDFDKLKGRDIFIAEREGAANCMTRLKLKDNNTFIERRICFGISMTEGQFYTKGDTIFFLNAQSQNNDEYYKYAIIKLGKPYNESILGELTMFKDNKDTLENMLLIVKNEIK